MTEIQIKSDAKLGVTTQQIGNHPVTGLMVYRRFRSLFSDVEQKQHRITYEEWQVGNDGKIYQELYSIKTYVVVDITDTAPQQLKYQYWLDQIGPVLLPEIANTLLNKLPIDSEGFTVV